MSDRETIIATHPLPDFLESRGILLKNGAANRCAKTEHKLGHLCMAVKGDVWYCNDCKEGGSIIDWLMMSEGISVKDAMERLGGSNGHAIAPKAPPVATNGAAKRPVKIYDYTDEKGVILFQVARYEPKDFRQRAPDGKGGFVYKLDGVRRVIYNLPKVIAADVVFVTEGEKDADTIASMGLVGTTNCGGSEKWLPEYSAFFRGKEIVLLPDNDTAGEKHLEKLQSALGKVVKSMRIVKMPEGVKDVSDFAATFTTTQEAAAELIAMAENAEILFQGEHVPVYTMAEMETRYREHIKRCATHQMNIGPWLPTFNAIIRPLVPGEIFTILAGTGVGKTMLLQNLAINTTLETLLFEAELPDSLTFERFVALATKSSGGNVNSVYSTNGTKDWKGGKKLDHIACCMESQLTPAKISKIIGNTALKTSVRPVLVLIDYIQLLGASSDSRYERISDVAEQLKVIAKATGTIIVVASQVSRPAKKGEQESQREIGLTDGKDSGSIENSSGLVWGAWRDGTDPDRMWLRILKNTKGVPGKTIPCRIHESLLINEEAQIAEPEPLENPHRNSRRQHAD